MKSWVLGLVLCGATLLGAVLGPSRAEARPPRRVSLQYTRAQDALQCIDPVTLAHKVEAFTGPVLVAPSSAEAALEAHVQAKAGRGFRVRIQLSRAGESPHGERSLEVDSPDCRSFDDALAFVIATTIDPDLVLERVGALFDPTATPPKQALLDELGQKTFPRTTELPAQAVVAAKTPPAPPPVIIPERRVEPLRLTLGIGVGMSNAQPVPSLGPALVGRLPVVRWLELGAGARMMWGLSKHPVDAGATVSTRQFSSELLLCPRAPWGDWLVASLCVGPELSLLRVAGLGFRESRVARNATLGVVLRPELALRVSPKLSLRLAASVRLGARNRLAFEQGGDASEFFATPVATIGGELSVGRVF